MTVENESTVGAAKLLQEVSDMLLERNRKLWEKQGHNNDLRKDIARAYVEQSLLNRLKTLLDERIVLPISAGGIPMAGEFKFGFVTDVPFDLSTSHAKLFSDLSLSVAAEIPYCDLDKIESIETARRQLRADQVVARTAAGRHTILEAAELLAKDTGWLIDRWIMTLRNAISNGKLPLRNPRDFSDRLPYPAPNKISIHYDEVDSAGLNIWLISHPEWSVTFRFPTPNPSQPANTKVKAIPRWCQHESELLSAIAKAGYEKTRLPRSPNGKPGVRSKIRKLLPQMSDAIFDKTYHRALKLDCVIKMAD